MVRSFDRFGAKIREIDSKIHFDVIESSSQIGHFGTACGINLVNAVMQLSVGHSWPSNRVGLRTALRWTASIRTSKRNTRKSHTPSSSHKPKRERNTKAQNTQLPITAKPNHNEALLLPCYRCRSSWHLHHDVPSHRRPSWHERYRCGCDRH